MDVIEFHDRFSHSMQSRQTFARASRRLAFAPQRGPIPTPYGKQPGRFQALRRFVVALAVFSAAWVGGLAVAQARPVQVVAFGDSLSAGYQLPADAAFPVVLEKALRAKGLDVYVANAGVSGDTAEGGLERLDWSVPDGTDAVILELGANDMLRGLDPATAKTTLDTILTKLQARGIKVLLAGIYALPSLGQDYGTRFNAIYPALAKQHNVPLYPFFLDGVTPNAGLKLADGMHPNAAGVEVVVKNILPAVETLVRSAAPKS